MKVILYMATTANGMIARENDDSDFLSGSEWKEYLRMVKSCGNCIIGRRTYEFCTSDPNQTFPFPNAINVVMTKKKFKNKWPNQVIFTDKSPKGILTMLRQKGFKFTFLAGGSALNSSFMKAGLVDEIYIDIVPLVLGKGITLFADASFEHKLRLIDSKKFLGGVVQLHYKVLR
jgi:dihydrofolate reductase